MSDIFLWGGFVFTLLWHGVSWTNDKFPVSDDDSNFYEKQTLFYEKETLYVLRLLNIGLSGVALCGFGYLAFGTI